MIFIHTQCIQGWKLWSIFLSISISRTLKQNSSVKTWFPWGPSHSTIPPPDLSSHFFPQRWLWHLIHILPFCAVFAKILLIQHLCGWIIQHWSLNSFSSLMIFCNILPQVPIPCAISWILSTPITPLHLKSVIQFTSSSLTTVWYLHKRV